MAGRAQAANLTGMLSQLANTVGEMGGAYDYLGDNIRDYAAPDIKDGSFESLSEYADWAQRNGKQEVADRYRALAMTQQQKSKKGLYAQALGERQERIRNLDKGIYALSSTIDAMPDTANNSRRPMQPADNGGFRRPVGQQPQQQQPQGNVNKEVLARRLQEMKAQLSSEYAAMNKLGADNVQFGGVGTEGTVFERSLASEKQAAEDAALSRESDRLSLVRDQYATNKVVGENEFRAGQTSYIRRYDDQFLRVKQAEAAVRDARTNPEKEERRNYLAEQQLLLSDLEQEWQNWGDQSQNQGAYDAKSYAEKVNKDFADNEERMLDNTKKQLGIRAAAQAEQQANADTLAIAEAARRAAKGIFELTPTELEQMRLTNPLAIPKMQSELKRHRENDTRMQVALLDGRAADDVLSYARGLNGANSAIATALQVYEKSLNPDTSVLSVTEEQKRAAKALTTATNNHRNTASTNQEAIAKTASVVSFTNMWQEYSTDRAFTDDLMDGISVEDENLDEFNNYVESFMAIDGASVIKDNEAYVRYAVMARDAMGLNTDDTNLGEVIDKQDTAQVFSKVVGEATEAEYQRITAEEPLVSDAAAWRRASQEATTLVTDMQKFLNLDANEQKMFLEQEIKSATEGNTRFPPRFINLFNGVDGAKSVVSWMEDRPGQGYSYKGFQEEKK